MLSTAGHMQPEDNWWRLFLSLLITDAVLTSENQSFKGGLSFKYRWLSHSKAHRQFISFYFIVLVYLLAYL